MATVGADAEELEKASAGLQRAADQLDEHSRALSRQLDGLSWLGRFASSFLMAWNGQHKPYIGSTAAFIREAAERLAANAQQQREASGSSGSIQGAGNSTLICEPRRFGSITPRVVTDFDSKGSGRADIVEAFYATSDGRRAEGDEIEIRKLDNGRYIVVLPGVVDLQNKLASVGGNFFEGHAVDPWYDGSQPNTVRRMAYAISESQDTSDSFLNPYASRVMEQMQRAGVPEGADVMLIGHSFGAYTAMELAGNDNFNSADGTSAGYHVNITHVVSAGADTNWKLPELPNATNALILNNRRDAVFVGEDPLVSDVSPRNSGQVQIEFYGQTKGLGHSPDNYANWLTAASDRPELNSWLDGAGAKYSGNGTAFSVKVPDYQ